MKATRGNKNEGLWIKDVVLVTQNQARESFIGHLYVRNGKIEELVKKGKGHSGKRTSQKAGNTLSGEGLVLFPGFIQTHLHLCQTLFRNLADGLELLDWLGQKIWRFEAAHNPESITLSAEIGIYELLSTGTTSILDMGTIRHTEHLFHTALRRGIRANIGKCLMDDASTCPSYLVESTKAALSEAKELQKTWHQSRSPLLSFSYAPRFALSCTSDLLENVAQIIKQNKFILHTHTSENQKEIQFVQERTGKTNIDYLHAKGLVGPSSVLAHGVWLNEKERVLLAKQKATITHCPTSNLKLGSGVAPLVQLLAHKINVGIGADGAACNNRLDAVQEMRLACLLQFPLNGPRSINAQMALDLATLNGAKALGLKDQIGSIEEGKSADFSLWSLFSADTYPSSLQSESLASALIYCSRPDQLVATFVAGNWGYHSSKSRIKLGKTALGGSAEAPGPKAPLTPAALEKFTRQLPAVRDRLLFRAKQLTA